MLNISSYWLLIRKLINVVGITPFDTDTSDGRSQERYRRLGLTSLASFITKGISLLISFFSISLTFKYLGSERYGLWMTASSFVGLLGFIETGLGGGLLNAISESEGKEDHNTTEVYISNAFFLSIVIAALIFSIFLFLYPFVPWHQFFNIYSDVAIGESDIITLILLLSLLFNIPIGIAQHIQMGFQEGYKNHFWSVVGIILGFIGVLLSIYMNGGLLWIVLSMCAGPTTAKLLNWILLLRYSRPQLFPQWRNFNWTISKKLAVSGILFMALQAMTVIGISSDNLVIAQILGASAVAGYAIVQKLFMTTMLTQFFVLPLWPAFGEALARNDHSWAEKALTRGLKISMVVASITTIPLLLFYKEILFFWIGPEVVPPFFLVLGFSLFVFLNSYNIVISSFLNTKELLRYQVYLYGFATVIAVILKIFLTNSWGVAGPVWGSIFAYGVIYTIPATQIAYRHFILEKVDQSE